MPGKTTDKNLSFEQAIDRLEDIVEQIESGEVGLEDALARYEQGQQLIKRCRGILDKAERRIAELTVDDQGRPKIESADEQDGVPDDADGSADDR